MRGIFQCGEEDSERLAEKTNGSVSDPLGVTETNGPETIETSGQQPSGACVSELTEKAGSLRGSLRSREGVEVAFPTGVLRFMAADVHIDQT